MARLGSLGFIIYLIAGLYFVNSAFNIVVMPAFILGIQKWIFLVGGVLIIIAGIRFLSRRTMPIMR